MGLRFLPSSRYPLYRSFRVHRSGAMLQVLASPRRQISPTASLLLIPLAHTRPFSFIALVPPSLLLPLPFALPMSPCSYPGHARRASALADRRAHPCELIALPAWLGGLVSVRSCSALIQPLRHRPPSDRRSRAIMAEITLPVCRSFAPITRLPGFAPSSLILCRFKKGDFCRVILISNAQCTASAGQGTGAIFQRSVTLGIRSLPKERAAYVK